MLAPENTLKSFRLAADEGVNEIELDIRMSSDDVMVIMHDATVDRTTDGSGPVAALTLAQLKELDAGDGERIPTFEEVTEAIDLRMQAEIKAPEAVGPLVRLMRSRPDLMERICPTSFVEDAVRELVAALPDTVPVGLISGNPSRELVEMAHSMGAARALLKWTGVDEDIVAAAHELGLQVGVWQVRTCEAFERAVRLGVDGVTTDDPRVLRECGYALRGGVLIRSP